MAAPSYDGIAEVGRVPPLSEMEAYEKLRIITDAHAFLVPAIFLLGAVFLWLSLRLLLRRDPGRIRRMIGLWLDAKEHELRTRGGNRPSA